MIKKILGTFSSKLMAAGINFLIVWMTANYLGASGKGETALIILHITLIQLLNNFVGGTALVYLTPRSNSWVLLIPSYIWAIIASGFGTTVLFYSGRLDATLVPHIFILSLIFSFFSIHQMHFMGKEKIGWHNILSLLQVTITAGILIWFFLIANQPSVEYFLVAIYGAYGGSLVISWIAILLGIERFKATDWKKQIKGLFTYGFVAQISSLITFFNNRLTYYLLEAWNSTEAVGIYSTGVSILEGSASMLSKSIAMVQYSKVANETDEKHSIKMTNSLTKLSFWAAFIVIIMLILIPAPFYSFIFGKEFSEIHTVIIFLSPGILALSFSTTFLHYFSGKGMYRLVNIATGIALTCTFSLAYILMINYGKMGAGITTSIAYTVQSIYLYYQYRKISDFRILDLFKLKAEIELLKNRFIRNNENQS